MNTRERNIFLMGLFIVISVGLFFFCRLLAPSDLNAEQPAVRKTITAIVNLNKTTEALVHQTETASPVWGFVGTITPEPKTMTAVAGITETYAIGHVMTQVFLSGATYEPTPTATP